MKGKRQRGKFNNLRLGHQEKRRKNKLEKSNKYEVVLKIKYKESRHNQEFLRRIMEEKKLQDFIFKDN